MKSRRLLVLLFLLLLTACQVFSSSSPAGEGTLLYATVDEDGRFTGDLILSDLSGNTLESFTIPEKESADRIAFMLTIRASGIAIFRVDYGDTNQFFWLDTTTGEIKTLELGNANLYSGLSFNNTHYALFNNFVSDQSRFDIYLLDLGTGEVTDINALLGEDQEFFSWLLSPDESYLILRGETHYLLPTANPMEARQIQADGTISNIDFSTDSKHILLSTWGETENQVILQSVDGSESEVIYNAPGNYIQAAFINHEEILVLMEGKSIALNLATREEQVLFENGGLIRNIFRLPEDEGVFVNLAADSEETDDLVYGFIYINTISGEMKTYPELTDMWVLGGGWNANAEWVYLADDTIKVTSLKAVDLSNGKVVDLLDLEAPTSMFTFYNFLSQDSATSSAYYFDSDFTEKFIAINAETGKTYDLIGPEKYGGVGGINPENALLAYVVVSEETHQPTIMLFDLQNGKKNEFGPGRSPIWIIP